MFILHKVLERWNCNDLNNVVLRQLDSITLNLFEFCLKLTMEFDFVMDAVLVDRTTYTEEFIKEVVKFLFLRPQN